MKHAILILVLVVMGLAPTTVGAAQGQHFVIATLMDSVPVMIISEKVLSEAYKRLGMTIAIKAFPGERALQTANAGLVDGELYRKEGIEQTYPNLIRVPVAITEGEIVVFTTGKRFPVQGWQSLLPYKVGYIRGVKVIESSLMPGTKAVPVRNITELFRLQKAGITDVVVETRTSGLKAIKALELKDIFILEPPLLTFKLYHYLHKKNQNLIKPLSTVLEQMEKEGVIRDIQQQVMHAAEQ